MTGYTVHTGSDEKFASGWDRLFSGDKTSKKKAKKKLKATGKKTTAKKKATKKKK